MKQFAAGSFTVLGGKGLRNGGGSLEWSFAGGSTVGGGGGGGVIAANFFPRKKTLEKQKIMQLFDQKSFFQSVLLLSTKKV